MSGPEVIIIPIVGISFIIAIGVPSTLILKKLFWRPKERIPGFETRQSSVNSLFPPEVTAQALRIFIECWFDMIDKKNTRKAINKLNIYWKKDPIDLGQEYTVNGKTFSKASGLTRTKKDIDVWVFDKNKSPEEIKISGTALIHELIHVALWELEGDPDADHEGNLYKGWTEKHSQLEREANKRLKEKGL